MTGSPSTDEPLAAKRRRAGASSLVLVVDPDPDSRAMHVAGLALSGWAADGAADGPEALAKAISYRPAAVVTEMRVPHLDGFELCRLLRQDPDTRHIPILVMTDDGDEIQLARAREAGADRVLCKPCLPGELTRAVQTILTAARPLQPSPTTHEIPVAARATSRGSRSRLHQRGDTTVPPSSPPQLICPHCDRRLTYRLSHIGGVSARHSEQWDDFECSSGCGCFQYRHRTRKLRSVA
jgi:twitching motility two-component system response regulator PilH